MRDVMSVHLGPKKAVDFSHCWFAELPRPRLVCVLFCVASAASVQPHSYFSLFCEASPMTCASQSQASNTASVLWFGKLRFFKIQFVSLQETCGYTAFTGSGAKPRGGTTTAIRRSIGSPSGSPQPPTLLSEPCASVSVAPGSWPRVSVTITSFCAARGRSQWRHVFCQIWDRSFFQVIVLSEEGK